MEISTPIFSSKENSYTFKLTKHTHSETHTLYYDTAQTEFSLPAPYSQLASLVNAFILGTKKWFTVPLVAEKVLKRLRHEVLLPKQGTTPSSSGWFDMTFSATFFIIKPTEMVLQWDITEWKESNPVIPSDFLESTTPRPASPEQTPEVRNIQVHDSLIPVGDLPLSDLPPLNFSSEAHYLEENPEKEESKRRLREANLKLALAKLKAERMKQRYFEKYGEEPEDSENSESEFSDSEVEFSSFAR
jgi:hypothetical protein